MPLDFKRGTHQVAVADRGAANRDEHVGAGRLAQLARNGIAVVGSDAEELSLSARTLDERRQAVRVRRDDLVGAYFAAGFYQFVSRREDRNARFSSHTQCGMPGSRRQCDRAGIEPRTGSQQLVPVAKVAAGPPDIGASLRSFAHADDVSLAVHILLDYDRVGAAWQSRTGENAHSLAGSDRSRKAPPGVGFARDFQLGWLFGKVARAHGIAVHGGAIERRLRAFRYDVFGEDTPASRNERDALGCRSGRTGKHALNRLLDGEECHAQAPFAGAARYSPDLPPVFSMRRMPSQRMARSTDFSMS